MIMEQEKYRMLREYLAGLGSYRTGSMNEVL
jgi:hypothetical protein